jgi:hypothetical protein
VAGALLEFFSFHPTSMTTASTDLLRRLRSPGYLILSLAMVFPFVDLAMTVWPIRLGDVAWRFGVTGLSANAVGSTLLVLLLIYALALTVGDRRVVALVGVVAALAALVLLLGGGSFILDALQMKGRVRPDGVVRFAAASGNVLAKLLLYDVSAVLLAASAFRTVRATRYTAARASRTSAPLVVGGAKTVATPTAPVSERVGREAAATEVGP